MVAPTRLALIELLGNGAFLHDTEIPQLAAYAYRVRCGAIVEIGAAYGASAVVFLANSSDFTPVHSIDPFIPDPISGWRATAGRCRQSVRQALQGLHCLGAYPRWQLHEQYSHVVAQHWTTTVELLFIDGDHSYTGAKQDFDDWEGFIQPGGHIILHDSRHDNSLPPQVHSLEGSESGGLPGPTQLAQELRQHPRFELVEVGFSTTIWRRKGVHDFYYPETV